MPDPPAGTRRPSRTLRRGRRWLARSWQALVVGISVIAVGVLAVLSPGLVQADVRLDEGTVHVAKRVEGGLGVLNAQIDELAAYSPVGASQFRILQDEHVVLVHSTKSSKLTSYDVARNRLKPQSQLPTNARVQLGGGILLVVNPDNGKAWYGTPEAVLALDFQEEKAHLEVGEFGIATVTHTGDIIGLDVQRSMLVRPGQGGVVETPLPFTVSTDIDESDISSVGSDAVVLDRQGSRIWVEGMPKPFEVSGASRAKLIPSAPDALGGEAGARAIYATSAGLIAVTSDGPRSLTGNLDGAPIEPVQVGDCVYAAFGEQFVKRCRGEEVDLLPIVGKPKDDELAFQVVRDTVVLNALDSGVIWMVNKNMLLIKDWGRVIPPKESPENEDSHMATVVPPNRDEENTPPIANDDELAARAGRSTVLNVLDNDTDPDGDVLTIRAETELSGATLQTVRGGTGLQITVDSETTGTLSFTYSINDGREGIDRAHVTVRVLSEEAADDNGAPYRHDRAAPLAISLNQSITKRVLMDWRDPDGDALVLVKAWMLPEAEDEVSFTPDGDVTFRDIGKTTGTKKVNVRVSDGTIETDGEMLVDVTDDVVPPIAYGDYESTAVGNTVEVHPLANDVGEALTLTEVDAEGCACEVTPNYSEQSFSFTSETPGTHYVTYKVSNGPLAMGVVRIDVRSASTNQPPVAALDVALLPPGGSIMIDPLLNDTDDDGDVLVVQSISKAPPGLQVVLEQRHLVTITDQHTPSGPVTLTYRVSDGKYTVRGTIIVIPTDSTGSPEPQAERDEVRVRAGAMQSVDVLANDTSPVGLDLTLEKLVENPLGERAWIDGDRIRVDVPDSAQSSNFALTYEIRDSDGNVASSTLGVTVISDDAQNEAPTPRPVVERVLAGTTSRLIIPLDGIDRNGDAVRLVGLGSGPKLGRVVAVGDGWLTYEAYEESKGTDVFKYQVVDSLGARGTGEIRVGVAPSGPDNFAPIGVMDEITVRPGRQVQIPALRNDVDVDGDAISYIADDPVQIDGVEDIEIVGNTEISFVAPQEPGTYTGTYWIQDIRLLQGSGQILLVVDEGAPELPPEARDDVVPVAEVAGKDWVDIDVTANDFDPDGRQEDLRVEVPDYGAREGQSAIPTKDGRRVTAPVTERMQQIRYRVIDVDGRSATAVILLPGRSDAVPVLKDPAVVLETVAGRPLHIDINSHVAGTAGHTVRLTLVDTIAVTHGDTLPDDQGITYTADVAYDGPDALVFEVMDVSEGGDEDARRAYISIPITVSPAPNRPDRDDDDDIGMALAPPEPIGGDPVLEVGPGEGNARLDLMPLFRDPDGDSFYFEELVHLSGDKSIDYEVSSDQSKVVAHTVIETQPGTVRTLSGKVVDANNGKTEFRIQLRVVASTRPLATTVADVAVALAGEEVAVPVLANDKSNLLADATLTLTDAKVVNGSGTATFEGDLVKVTPDEGFVGTLTARYTVMDATKDPDRSVDGTIRVTVRDRPSTPGAPRNGVTGNGTVTFTYTPGSSNGFEIISRVATAITATGAEVGRTECQSTTCTVTGLPNGEPYQFSVVETNQVGPSEHSPLSAAYTPDVKPNAPSRPVVTFDDKRLTVTWRPPVWDDPSSPGSKVDRYTLVLLDAAGNQVGIKERLSADSTSHTWTGLANGTRYRFKVLAGNAAGESPFSGLSDVEWPAGPPSAPGSIMATATQNPLGGAFEVTWDSSAIDANGDPIKQFVVTPISDSGDVLNIARTVDASGAGSQMVRLEGLGQMRYRFKVQAKNKAGPGAAATTQQWQVAWELPQLSGVSAKAGEGLITVLSTSNFATRPEAHPVKQYSLSGGGWQTLPNDGRITGLTNGRVHDVAVRVLIDGPRASEPEVFKGLMPRTTTPVWPDFERGSFHFQGTAGLVVVLTKPKDLVESGGWDPDGYRYHCQSDLCDVSAWTTSNSFRIETDKLDKGARFGVDISHRDAPSSQTSHYEELVRPFASTWDRGSRSFNFRLHYVTGTTCIMTASSGVPGVEPFTHEFKQGGGTSTSFKPDPISLPTDVDYTSMQLQCTGDQLNDTFTIS